MSLRPKALGVPPGIAGVQSAGCCDHSPPRHSLAKPEEIADRPSCAGKSSFGGDLPVG